MSPLKRRFEHLLCQECVVSCEHKNDEDLITAHEKLKLWHFNNTTGITLWFKLFRDYIFMFWFIRVCIYGKVLSEWEFNLFVFRFWSRGFIKSIKYSQELDIMILILRKGKKKRYPSSWGKQEAGKTIESKVSILSVRTWCIQKPPQERDSFGSLLSSWLNV